MRKWWIVLLCMMVAVLAACGGQTTVQEGSANQPGGAASAQPAGSASASGETIELTYAFFAPANTFPAVQMQKWADELEKRSNGKVKVKLFPGGTLLTAKNMYDGVANKVADIGLSATSYEPGVFELYSISDLPSGYPNAKVASQVVYDLLQEFPPDALKDFKIITAFATEPSYIQSKKRASSLAELKGQRLRIPGANSPVVAELGATPVGMSQSEAVEALQTGVIEGYVSSREVLKDLKFAEMVKYVTDYPLSITTFVAVMNKQKWESLPPDVQKLVDELAPEMPVFTGEYLDGIVKDSIQWSKDKHQLEIVPLADADKAELDKKYEAMQKKLVQDYKAKGLPAEAFNDKLHELIKKYSSQ